MLRAVDGTVDWVLGQGYRNVLIEINNECNVRYDHAILQPGRVHELIARVEGASRGTGGGCWSARVTAATPCRATRCVAASDFVLLHGNGVTNPDRIAEMVRLTRQLPGYTPKPILFNEDDHYDFDKPWNNFVAATSAHASWGFFDFRRQGEGLDEGYQSVPVNWGISSARKRGFFNLLQGDDGRTLTGGRRCPAAVSLSTAVGACGGPVG